MQITKQADYAVRAVLELARLPKDQRLTAEEIAERWDIPGAFLSKTLGLLSDAGIVATQRGVKGGVRLNRPAGRISLLEVIEAVDGPISLNFCALDPEACKWSAECPAHPLWCSLLDQVRVRLASVSIRELASQTQPLSLSPVHAAP